MDTREHLFDMEKVRSCSGIWHEQETDAFAEGAEKRPNLTKLSNPN